jgi:hypothetical protein
MKKIVFALFILSLTVHLAYGQSTNQPGLVKYFPVSSDEMKYTQNGYVPDANLYWVETDESFGEVILNFSGLNHPKTPVSANLILNIPQVSDAQSNTGVLVYFDNKLIGKAVQATANSNLKINLEINQLIGKTQFTLILKGGGIDGLAISSKVSGLGPVLEFAY